MSTDRRVGRPVIKSVAFDTPSKANTARRLLADIRELAPGITARAAEIEDARRIPPDLAEALRSIGVFRMFVPQSHGGFELDLPTGLEIITALGRIDGSLGWIAMNSSGGNIITPSLPRETYDKIYQNGPDVAFAGSIQPVGTAGATAGAWPVRGPCPFATASPPPHSLAG